MCGTNRFCFCFSPQVGAMFVSSFMITIAGLGLLLTPFLPFSKEANMAVILGYMALLLITFLIGLCGSWLANTKILIVAIIMGCIAIVMWVALTFPSFVQPDRPFCIGFRCGESHWLVPRQWNPMDDENLVKTFTPRPANIKNRLDENEKGIDANGTRVMEDKQPHDTSVDDDEDILGLNEIDDYGDDEDSNDVYLKQKEKNSDLPADIDSIEMKLNKLKEKEGFSVNVDNIEMKLNKLKEKEDQATDDAIDPDIKTNRDNIPSPLGGKVKKKKLRAKNKKRSTQNPEIEMSTVSENTTSDDTPATPQKEKGHRPLENELEPWKNFDGHWTWYPKASDAVTEADDLSPESPEFKRIERFLKLNFVGSGTVVEPKTNEIEEDTLDRLMAMNYSADNLNNLLTLLRNSSYIHDKARNPSLKDNRDSNRKLDHRSEQLNPEDRFSRRGRNVFSLPKGKYERVRRDTQNLDTPVKTLIAHHEQRAESLLRPTTEVSIGMAFLYGATFLCALATLGMYLGHLRQEDRANKYCCGYTEAIKNCDLGRPQKSGPPKCGESRPSKCGESRPRPCGESRARNYGETRPRTCGESRPQNYGESRPQNYGEGRPRTCGESRSQNYGEGRPRHCGESRPRNRGESRPQRCASSQSSGGYNSGWSEATRPCRRV